MDRYYASDNLNNADVYTPDDPDNQILTFTLITSSDYGYYYQIKVNGYYLTQQGNDVRWTVSPNGDYSVWLAEEVIRVTNIPKDSGSYTDYFAVWSGLTNGTFKESAGITNLYRKCFGSAGANGRKYYNMYGQIYTGSTPASYKGKFHPGIDLDPGEGTEVKAPISGTVVYSSSSDYGTVAVKETGTNRLFLFMHMKNLLGKDKPVTEGVTTLGTVSGIGSGGAMQFDAHLHVEVHPAGSKNYGDNYQMNSFYNQGASVPVYDYF
ncbi:MAG: M23 family metallopeptidase [Clostridiales bacterium]|nr:M23 family metallopeptidase [Clostridiales bacterium]